MTRTETQAALTRVMATYEELATHAAGLSDEALDQEVPGYGGRPTPVRGLLYGAANHAREHVNHINKILRANNGPTAQQTEANAILEQTAQAMGALAGVLARISDEELNLSHENQTISGVLEHVAGAQEGFARFLRDGLS